MNEKRFRLIGFGAILSGVVCVAVAAVLWISPLMTSADQFEPVYSVSNEKGPTTLYLLSKNDLIDPDMANAEENSVIQAAESDPRIQDLYRHDAAMAYIGYINQSSEETNNPLLILGMEAGNKLWQVVVDMESHSIVSIGGPFTVHDSYFVFPAIVGLLLVIGGSVFLYKRRKQSNTG